MAFNKLHLLVPGTKSRVQVPGTWAGSRNGDGRVKVRNYLDLISNYRVEAFEVK